MKIQEILFKRAYNKKAIFNTDMVPLSILLSGTIASFFLFALGGLMVLDTIAQKSEFTPATGQVLITEAHKIFNWEWAKTLTVEFPNNEGGIYTQSIESFETHYQKGDSINILYQPKHPDRFILIDSFKGLWSIFIIWFSVCVLFSIYFIFLWLQRQRQMKSPYYTTKSEQLNFIGGLIVKSQNWQEIKSEGLRRIEVHYFYENQSYKSLSQPISDKQFKKTTTSKPIALIVGKADPNKIFILL